MTAGASAPDELVDAVVARLAPRHGVEEVHVTDEDEYFPPPPELRDLLRGLGRGAWRWAWPRRPRRGAARGRHRPTRVDESGAVLGDRHISAADVLARLAG